LHNYWSTTSVNYVRWLRQFLPRGLVCRPGISLQTRNQIAYPIQEVTFRTARSCVADEMMALHAATVEILIEKCRPARVGAPDEDGVCHVRDLRASGVPRSTDHRCHWREVRRNTLNLKRKLVTFIFVAAPPSRPDMASQCRPRTLLTSLAIRKGACRVEQAAELESQLRITSETCHATSSTQISVRPGSG
jgi:hypothetical protein